MSRFMLTGMMGTQQWFFECDTILEAKEHAYQVLEQGGTALLWDRTNLVLELCPRYDGLGVS